MAWDRYSNNLLYSLIVISILSYAHARCNRPFLPYTVEITPDQNTYEVGEVIAISCRDERDVFGPTSSTCLADNVWDYELTSDEPTCSYCYRPIFVNPYAIILTPDQPIYSQSEAVTLTCEAGHTPSRAPPLITTCLDYNNYNPWSYDFSDILCFAQCDTQEVLDSDVIARHTNSGGTRTNFDHLDEAEFSCRDGSRLVGQVSATCINGSFNFIDIPTCLDPCPVQLNDMKDGLSYTTMDRPVINETSTLYYGDGASILYSCAGDRTPEHCAGVCRDGSWDPRDVPSCIVTDGLKPGAIAGISILTILLLASLIINALLYMHMERSKSKSKGKDIHRVNTDGSVELATSSNAYKPQSYTSLNFEKNKPAPAIPTGVPKWVTFLTKLGSLGMGDFGEVWKGEVRSTQEVVLIRQVPDDAVQRKDILGRVKVFSKLPQHPNIVECLGYFPNQNIILYKFISGGTLLTHLQMKRGQPQPTYAAYTTSKPRQAPVDEVGLINFALQVAKGVQFLASEKITHGALCAHNILLDEEKVCKVSDYGMAPSLFGRRARLSRWSSPETMRDGVFSPQSDVWSFGIVLWEIMSLGDRPFPDLDLDRIVSEIANGYKMPRPPHCSEEIYTIMCRCWERERENRPGMEEIVENLDKILVHTQENLNYLLLNDLDNDTYHTYASVL